MRRDSSEHEVKDMADIFLEDGTSRKLATVLYIT
jgi:hypothetical protein